MVDYAYYDYEDEAREAMAFQKARLAELRAVPYRHKFAHGRNNAKPRFAVFEKNKSRRRTRHDQ